MTFFKRLWFPFAFIVIATMVGCVKADRQQRSDVAQLQKASLYENLASFNNRALFEMGNIELEDIKFSNVHKKGDLRQVDQVQLFLRVCSVRDRATQGTIRNERFHVESELGSNITWSTDGNKTDEAPRKNLVSNPIIVNSGNCMRWSQQITHFNYLAPSKNIILHYSITSLSGNLGQVVKRISFNPWDMYRNNSLTKGFFDLTDFSESEWHTGERAIGEKEIVQALQGFPWPENKQKLKLQIDGLSVLPAKEELDLINDFNLELKGMTEEEKEKHLKSREAHLKNKDLKMKIELKGMPFVTLEDSTGNVSKQEFWTGRFKVYLNVIASGVDPGSGDRFRLAEDISTASDRLDVVNNSRNEVKATTYGLLASIPMYLRADSEYGSVNLAVKIEPLDLKGVEPFEAVYTLGPHDKWISRSSPMFASNLATPLTEVDYDKYVNSAKIVDEELFKKITTLRPAEMFFFNTLNARFMRIMPGETATDRRLMYSVKSCVDDGFWGTRAGRGLQFRVVTHDEGEPYDVIRQTNEEGCLTWFGYTSHKYYRKEVLLEKKALVTYVGNTVGLDRYGHMVDEFDQEFVYYMNPWDEKWTFGWDVPDMPANYAENISKERLTAPESKLFIADFKYQTMGFRYEIDEFLNLKVKKSVLLVLFPYVLKYNSIVQGRKGTEKLRDGIYLMKVALQKDYLDPAAKGVRLYNCKNKVPIDMATADPSEINLRDPYQVVRPNGKTIHRDPLKIATEEGYGALRLDDILDPHQVINREETQWESCAAAEIVNDPDKPEDTDVGRGTQIKTEKDEYLRRNKKRYVSAQEKLVRVQGGMIITPIEFEVDDLRLMRIRNQFFIQLQTIDETALRVAAVMKDGLEDISEDDVVSWSLQKGYNELYELLGDIDVFEDDAFDNEAFDAAVVKFGQTADIKEAIDSFRKLGIDVDEASEKIISYFKLDQVGRNTQAFQVMREEVDKKLVRMLQYKKAGLDGVAAYRGDRSLLIRDILAEIDRVGAENFRQSLEDMPDIYQIEAEQDPLLKEFFLGRNSVPAEELILKILQRRIHAAHERGDMALEDVLRSLTIADFTQLPLTPAFEFDLIRNDGIHSADRSFSTEKIKDGDQKPQEDDGLSGLAARTFVGPLTFVFNTNGSALRPTDTLGEADCSNAFCESPDIAIDAANTDANIAYDVDENGRFSQDINIPVRKMGETVNLYQNDPYYGYLGDYEDYTVDMLIDQQKLIEEENRWKMKLGSQLSTFTRTMKLKYVLLHDREESRLKDINLAGCEKLSANELDDPSCLQDITSGPLILPKATFLDQLNERVFLQKDMIPNRYEWDSSRLTSPEGHYSLYQKKFTAGDVEEIIETDLDELLDDVTNGGNLNIADVLASNSSLVETLKMHRGFYQKMCFVLAQNFFKRQYFRREFNLKNKNSLSDARDVLQKIELKCQKQVAHMYGFGDMEKTEVEVARDEINRNLETLVPLPNPVHFSPIVFERKARVYNTTGKYLYKGGKSLNINLNASFNLSASHGIKVAGTGTWKPYESATSAIATGVGFGAAVWGAMKVGAVAGGTATANPIGAGGGAIIAALVVGVYKFTTGAFGWSRTNSKDESAGRTDGVSVTAGTFLVSQQATLDIELGKYERCMVARFHPAFIHNFFADTKGLKNFKQLSEDFGAHTIEENSDLEALGVMICTGLPKKKCLPITEKYYYFTQHFTEGDMLDTADLHNHPWLLQLRGVRDFKIFTSAIGAKEVDYIDSPNWGRETLSRTLSDGFSFKMSGTDKDSTKREFQIVSQESDINWPLEELSRVYFNVLPTFPGLYTFYEKRPEYPYFNTDAGRSFKCNAE